MIVLGLLLWGFTFVVDCFVLTQRLFLVGLFVRCFRSLGCGLCLDLCAVTFRLDVVR